MSEFGTGFHGAFSLGLPFKEIPDVMSRLHHKAHLRLAFHKFGGISSWQKCVPKVARKQVEPEQKRGSAVGTDTQIKNSNVVCIVSCDMFRHGTAI